MASKHGWVSQTSPPVKVLLIVKYYASWPCLERKSVIFLFLRLGSSLGSFFMLPGT